MSLLIAISIGFLLNSLFLGFHLMYVTNLLCFLMLCRKLHSKTKQIKVLLMMPSLHSVLISKTLVIYFTLFFNVFKKFVLLFNATTNLNGYIADICILYTNCYKKREQRKILCSLIIFLLNLYSSTLWRC